MDSYIFRSKRSILASVQRAAIGKCDASLEIQCLQRVCDVTFTTTRAWLQGGWCGCGLRYLVASMRYNLTVQAGQLLVLECQPRRKSDSPLLETPCSTQEFNRYGREEHFGLAIFDSLYALGAWGRTFMRWSCVYGKLDIMTFENIHQAQSNNRFIRLK